jgi:hypothetical protein
MSEVEKAGGSSKVKPMKAQGFGGVRFRARRAASRSTAIPLALSSAPGVPATVSK